jgi:hypothetical protein
VSGSELVDWGMLGLATFSVPSTMNGGELFELIKDEVESRSLIPKFWTMSCRRAV